MFCFYLKILIGVLVIVHLHSVYGVYINDTEYNSVPPLTRLEYFDECKWKGDSYKYCLFEMKIFPIENTTSHTWEIIQELKKDKLNLRHDLLERGHCLKINTNSTKDDEVAEYTMKYNNEFYNESLQVKITKMSCNYFHDELDKYDVIMIVILVAIITINLVCTTVDALCSRLGTACLLKSGKLIKCFSIQKNWNKLLTVNDRAQDMKYVQGIRFLTMALIIFGHAVMAQFNSPIYNSRFLENHFKFPASGLIMNGSVVIQTYFFLSGMFLSIKFFQIMFKYKFHIKYLFWAFLERYLRLTPSFALITLFSATLFYHMGDGAFWERNIGQDRENCRKNWWANALYISNELKSNEMCLLTGWFLSADIQLFIFALCVFTIIWFKKKWLLEILASLFIISMIIPGVMTYVYQLEPQLLPYPEVLRRIFEDNKTFHLTYLKTYTNASTYLFGMLIGYAVHTGAIKKAPTYALWFISLLHIFALICSIGILLGAFVFYTEYYTYNVIFASIFASVYKVIFVVITALLVWASYHGYAGMYMSILEWKPFVILGRLSFSMYLTHWPLLRFLTSRYTREYYNDFYSTTLIRYSSTLIMTIIISTLLALLVEFPVAGLIKIFNGSALGSNHKNTPDDLKINGDVKNGVNGVSSLYNLNNNEKTSNIFNIQKFHYNRESIE